MKKIRWDLIGILGGIAGVIIAVIAVIKAGGPNSIYIAVAMVLVFGGMGYFLNKFLWQPKNNTRRLQMEGIPGSAKILEVHETNITVNQNPQYKLVLEIKTNLGQIYTTGCKTVVSRRSNVFFQPGKEISVKIDPKNEKNVIVDAS
jgi:hypothetical protein